LLYVSLLLYLLAFSLGAGLFTLAILTYRKLRNRGFLDVALLFGASVLLVLVSSAGTYGMNASGFLDRPLFACALLLSVLGNGLLGFALPSLGTRLVGVRISPLRALAHAFLVAASMGVGVARVIVQGLASRLINPILFLALAAYVGWVVLRRLDRIDRELARARDRGYDSVSGARRRS